MSTTNPSEFAQRAAGVARNTDPGSSAGCFICQQKLYVQFFFDGFGHSREDDEKAGLMSNVAKLSRAAIFDADKGIRTVYVDGPGTPLKARVDRGRNMSGRAAGEVAIAPANLGSEIGAGAAIHAAEGRNPLHALRPASLKEGLVSAVIEGLLGWAAEASPTTRDSKFFAAIAQTGYDARLAYAFEQLTTIVNEQRLRVKEIHIAVYGADRGATLARAFVNQLIKANSYQDRTNPDAVHFPTANGPARVFFRFMGLFDASSTLGKLTGLGMPILRNDAGDVFKLLVPKQVECCVHLAGAHEFRHSAPVHSIGTVPIDVAAWLEEQSKKEKSKADAARAMKRLDAQLDAQANAYGGKSSSFTDHDANAKEADWKAVELHIRAIRIKEGEGNRIEKLYAGAQDNVVGGGYKDGEYGKYDELSKLPLREMHKQAFLNGCPLLSENKIAKDVEKSQLFELRKMFQLSNGQTVTVEDLHRAYMAGKPTDVSAASMEAHAIAYMHWMHDRLLALDRMPPENRAKMHEVKNNIPLTIAGKCKEVRGNPQKYRAPLPISPSERRVFDAFDKGAALSEACRKLFDDCVYTPMAPSYFSPRSIDVTEDDSPEGKQFKKQQDAEAKKTRDDKKAEEKRVQDAKDAQEKLLKQQRSEAVEYQRTQSRW